LYLTELNAFVASLNGKLAKISKLTKVLANNPNYVQFIII